LDSGVADKRLCIVEAEYGRLLRTENRSGSVISAVRRQAWDGGDLRTTTKHDAERATNAHISIIGHITKEELDTELPLIDVYSGSANRILHCCARRQCHLPRPQPLDPGQLRPIVDELRRVLQWASEQADRVITFDEEAWRLWDAIYYAMPDRVGAF